MDVVVRPVEPEVARPFRQALLRPDSPARATRRPEDALPGAQHYGAFLGATLVGAASVHPEPAPGEPGAGWRLRGMVVAPEHRRRGVGARVLDACVRHVSQAGGAYVWCSARVAARPFYLRHGFAEAGETWHDPTTGAHVRMVRLRP